MLVINLNTIWRITLSYISSSMVICGSTEFCQFLLGLVRVLPKNFLKYHPVESERTIWCGMIADDCLPSGSSLYLYACWAHLCTFSTMVDSIFRGFYPPLDGLKRRFCCFPFYSLPVDPFFLATTPFPSRIAKNIKGQMVVPCSRVLAFLLTVSNRKIWSPTPQILAFSPEWLRVVKSGN